jgi:hypothetical protein
MDTRFRTNSTTHSWVAAGATVALAAVAALVPSYQAQAGKRGDEQEKNAPSPNVTDASTSLADQTDLAVTVYNSNIALIRDVRQLQLPSGNVRLKFMDIAATVNPATVHFRSLTEPGKVDVLEQNYEYDLLEPNKLLNKYVGKEVTLVRSYMDNGTTKREEVKAILLANNNGPVWRIGNDIVTGVYGENYRFPEVPTNLYDRPTLLMSLENSGSHKQTIETSYLASNLSWNADYVLTVGRDDKTADLDGWVTLVNNSGTAFHSAQLQLVAGDLNRVPEPMRTKAADMLAAAPANGRVQQFQQENFSEYHLYSLGRRTSVEDRETKQISLLEGSGIPVEKLFVLNGQNFYYRNAQSPGAPLKDPVQVLYKFKNEEKSGLGIPLPGGNLRVYQKDQKGGLLLIGEDHVDHTPKDEFVTVKIGSAFDVVAERRQSDFKKIADRVYEMEFAITLRNHKDLPVTIQVNEPIGGDWEMLSSSYPAQKTGAFAAQFAVPVKANGESVLTYRVRVHW